MNKKSKKPKHDLKNQKIGLLTCIDFFKKEDKKGYYWNCICDCGQNCQVAAGNLVLKSTKSCGCLYRSSNTKNKTKELKDKRFSNLVVIKKCEINHKRVYWECLCDCGNIKCIAASSLLRGISTSCGCNRLKRNPIERENIERYLKSQYTNYKSSCKKKNREFLLNYEDFIKILNENCFYCNKSGINTIDRVDSKLGYNKNNIIPCCIRCNIAKGNQTLDEFLNYLNRFYEMKESPLSLKEKIIKRLEES